MTWDALSDPIMASLSERINTRFGTYRPFLLYGCVFLGLAFIGLFWVPPFEGSLLIATLIITGLIFRTSYTIVAIPYATMASRLSYDSIERADFSGARMFCAFLGLLIVSMFLPPLVDQFTLITGSEKQAFQYVAALGSTLATLAIYTNYIIGGLRRRLRRYLLGLYSRLCRVRTNAKWVPLRSRRVWVCLSDTKIIWRLYGIIGWFYAVVFRNRRKYRFCSQ